MSEEEFTPETRDVRHDYVWAGEGSHQGSVREARRLAFNRWLRAEKEKAVDSRQGCVLG